MHRRMSLRLTVLHMQILKGAALPMKCTLSVIGLSIVRGFFRSLLSSSGALSRSDCCRLALSMISSGPEDLNHHQLFQAFQTDVLRYGG